MRRPRTLLATASIATAAAALAVLGGTAADAQDKYALTSPGGIAFNDFKGYEDWAVVSSARTDEVLKVIVANPAMIAAYKAGIPANGQPFPSLGSRDKPEQNADGSTDLYFGPKAPAGKAGSWLATVAGKGYFAILRLYGPTEAAFDKTWKPGDFEMVK